jgi:thiol-disulfide isomerase/thioredoxin
MKRLIIALVALSIFACKQEPKVDFAVISGKIENTKIKNVIITNGDFKAKIAINEDGTFADTLRIPENGFYTMSVGNEYTNIHLGIEDNVNMTVNANEFDKTIKYSGEGSVENNYLAAKILNNSAATANTVEFYSMDEDAFKTKLSEIKTANETLLNSSTNADKTFITAEKQNLLYDSYLMLHNYSQRHGYYTKKEDFEVSDSFIPTELKDMTFDDSKAYKSSSAYKDIAYDKALTGLFNYLGDDISSVSPEDLKAVSDIKIPALKNDVIDYLSSFLVSPSNENMESVYNFFMKNSTNDDTKKKLTETFENNKSLVNGKPSPQFVNYENHKGGDLSLTDLKGKYVYVDVWATWCGPCIAEIPSLKEVEKQFHGQNVEFVSISADNGRGYKGETLEEKALLAKEGWSKMIAEKELGGIQLYADKAFNSSFLKDYQINSIPRFILIDPNGNIVNGDAPRPSDPKLVELLESELKIQP